MKTPQHRTRSAFTLIETLTTLAIIVILTALLIPSLLNWRTQAFQERLHATSNLLSQACVRAGLAGELVPSESRGTLADVVGWYQTNGYVQKGNVDISGLTLDAIGQGSYFDCTDTSTETRTVIGAPVLPGPIAALWWNTRYIQLSVPNTPVDAQYLVLESSPDNQTWTEVASKVVDTYTDGPFQPNTSLYYRIVAVNSFGRTAGPSSKATTAPPLPAPNSLSIALGSTTTTTPNSPPALPMTYSLPTVTASPGSGSSSVIGNDLGGWEWLFASGGNNSAASYGGSVTMTPMTPPGAITFSSVTAYNYTLTLPSLPHDLVDINGRIFDCAWNWTLFSSTNGQDWGSSAEFDWRSALGPLDAKTGFGWICQKSGAWLENPAPVTFDATPGSTYYYRLVGQDTAGLLVYGDVISITTPIDSQIGAPATPPVSPNAPIAPTQVTINNLSQTALNVTMPPLPDRATSLTLEASTDGGNSWVVVATGLAGNAVVPQSNLTSAMTYAYCVSAVNSYGATQGSPIAITTLGGLPSAPGSVVVGNRTTNGYTFTLPQLPANATSFTLQTSENGATWTNVGTGYGSGALVPVTGLASNKSTPYLLLAVNQYGFAPGSPFFATTGGVPSTPAPPTATNLAPTSFDIQLPSLPNFATGLTLQSSPDEGGTWVPQSGNPVLAAHAVVSATATPGTTYTYRVVAVNQWGEAPSAALTVTTPKLPSTPDVATVLNLGSTGFRLLMPPLPVGATSLTLESYPGAWSSDAALDAWTSDAANQGLDGGVPLTVSEKVPSTDYTYRVVAVNQWGSTAGCAFTIKTLAPVPPGVPGAPTVSYLAPRSFTLGMPSLPSNTDYLALQTLPSGLNGDVTHGLTDLASVDESSWVYAGIETPAGQSVDVIAMADIYGFSPGSTYICRLIAVSMTGGSTAGAPFTVTIPTSCNPDLAAPAAPTVSNLSLSMFTLTMPTLPANAEYFVLQSGGFEGQYGGTAFADLASKDENSWGSASPYLPAYLSASQSVDVFTTDLGNDLVAGRTYIYRLVAMDFAGNYTATPFTVTMPTGEETPQTPDAAIVSDVSPSGFTLTMPSLPAYTYYLNLQFSFDGGNAWYNSGADASGGQTHYQAAEQVVFADDPAYAPMFRVVAIGWAGSTAGTPFTVITPPSVPATPATPIVSNVSQGGFTLTMPSLPANADYLTLQFSFDGGNAWYNFGADASGGQTHYQAAEQVVFADDPAYAPMFRVVATGGAGSTGGTPFSIINQ